MLDQWWHFDVGKIFECPKLVQHSLEAPSQTVWALRRRKAVGSQSVTDTIIESQGSAIRL